MDTTFTEELLRQLKQAEDVTGVSELRLAEQARAQGGVRAVREYLRRGQVSRQFLPLKEKGRLELSPENLVIQGKYAALFSDEEVNACLDALLEAGFFRR